MFLSKTVEHDAAVFSNKTEAGDVYINQLNAELVSALPDVA